MVVEIEIEIEIEIQWEYKKKLKIYIKVGKHSRVRAGSELVSESNELQSRGVTGQEGFLCFFSLVEVFIDGSSPGRADTLWSDKDRSSSFWQILYRSTYPFTTLPHM